MGLRPASPRRDMMRVMAIRWAENSDNLRKVIEEQVDLTQIESIDLVRLAFKYIYNASETEERNKINVKNIYIVNDLKTHGAIMYLMRLSHERADADSYIITYGYYGESASVDSIAEIQKDFRDSVDKENDFSEDVKAKVSRDAYDDIMRICRDVLMRSRRLYYDVDDNYATVGGGV